MDNDPIFTPLKFRNLTVKNRIFRSNISGRFDNEDGSLTQTRINWESKFAAGGVGAIISSYVPVLMEGRIIAGYATVHRDDFIPLWAKLGEAIHSFDAKFIMQLSHSGRQMDLPGVHNQARRAPSSTSRAESMHGFLCQAMSKAEIDTTIEAFARGAWRAREAGLDGVELHSANGYLFSQFMSSGINDRTDEYGGSLENRARFLLNVIEAIRGAVGRDFHLQVKLSAVDHNNVIPWEKPGNTLADTVTIAKWAEAAGADAIHVSQGSLFPHPLNPPGDLSLETLTTTYDAMISSGVHGMRNYLLFRYPLLRPIFHWVWFRMKKGKPIEGVNLEEARAIKKAVSVPVICTGGFQTASFIREAIQFRRRGRRFDRALARRQQRSRQTMGRRRRSAREALHLLQPLPGQRNEESDGLLRRFSLPEPRGDDRRGHVRLPRARRDGDPDQRGDFAMTDINAPFTAVQISLRSRMWLLNLVWILAVLLLLLGLAALIFAGVALFRFSGKSTPAYADDAAHFMYGSIGAEPHSGLPYWLWKTLPSLYPAEFEGRNDYSAFGFLYEKDADGKQRDLPIGISRRQVQGIDVVWFNCGTCHVGTWRETPDGSAARRAGNAVEQSRPPPLHPLRPQSRDRRAAFAG